MKKYRIKYIETYQRWYDVEANSRDEAEQKLLDLIMDGEVDGPVDDPEVIDSGCEEIEEIIE